MHTIALELLFCLDGGKSNESGLCEPVAQKGSRGWLCLKSGMQTFLSPGVLNLQQNWGHASEVPMRGMHGVLLYPSQGPVGGESKCSSLGCPPWHPSWHFLNRLAQSIHASWGPVSLPDYVCQPWKGQCTMMLLSHAAEAGMGPQVQKGIPGATLGLEAAKLGEWWGPGWSGGEELWQRLSLRGRAWKMFFYRK